MAVNPKTAARERGLPSAFGLPLLAYSHARSASYLFELRALTLFSGLVPGSFQPELPEGALLEKVHSSMHDLLRRDVARIESGEYPASVLWPESPLEHLKRIPSIALDAVRAQLRRRQGRTTVFSRRAKQLLEELPKYYQRNFHFQTDGYLSERSAELYDHQVELLFGGTGDAMRRLVLSPLRARLGPGDGAGLRILEIGAGAGSATRFVRLTFPRAHLVATDLSGPYLKVAQRKLKGFDRIDFLQTPGENLPFQDEQFDAVFSVFLFHELPLETRKAVFSEAKRVVKKDGVLAVVDSVQSGDQPEFEALLKNFSRDYHEPFFRDYLENPLRDLVRHAGFTDIKEEVGFLSRVVSAKRSS
jgi:ubiquinone/menaquinone biosynthesis C-methylase UbiE